jgi:hypothetical protein
LHDFAGLRGARRDCPRDTRPELGVADPVLGDLQISVRDSCLKSNVATWLSGTVRPSASGSCRARKVVRELRCSSRGVPRALPRCRRRGEHKVAQKEYSCIERYPETVPKFA